MKNTVRADSLLALFYLLWDVLVITLLAKLALIVQSFGANNIIDVMALINIVYVTISFVGIIGIMFMGGRFFGHIIDDLKTLIVIAIYAFMCRDK